jgi:hypothetical protein
MAPVTCPIVAVAHSVVRLDQRASARADVTAIVDRQVCAFAYDICAATQNLIVELWRHRSYLKTSSEGRDVRGCSGKDFSRLTD